MEQEILNLQRLQQPRQSRVKQVVDGRVAIQGRNGAYKSLPAPVVAALRSKEPVRNLFPKKTWSRHQAALAQYETALRTLPLWVHLKRAVCPSLHLWTLRASRTPVHAVYPSPACPSAPPKNIKICHRHLREESRTTKKRTSRSLKVLPSGLLCL